MKKKILSFLLFFLLFISRANADYLIPNGVDLDGTFSDVTHFIRYNGNWYVNTTTSIRPVKFGFRYDTSGLDKSKTYTFNMIAFVDDMGALYDSYSVPIANFAGSVCNISSTKMNSRWYDSNSEKKTYTEAVGTWFSVVCDNVKISNNTEYLDFFLGDDGITTEHTNRLNTGRFSYVESTTQSINSALQENNQTLNQINQTQQQTNEKLDETNKNLGELNHNITNSDSPDNMDGLSNSAGWLPAGPLDSLLNLPLSMLNNISTNLSKSCQPVNLPLPFVDKTLPLPCLSSIYSQIDGLGPWITTISVIGSAFILFSYLLKLYKWVDDTLTFRENNEIDNWGGL